jgi:ElaB/YqjD/DUF883 family membrane-anchored ribosome-binding protein
MSTDAVVSRELKSLHDEVSAAQRKRRAASSAPPTEPETASPETASEATDEKELRDQLTDFIDEVSAFFDQAEKNIAAHPTQSVIAALLVGILIGRLLGRR